MLKIRRVASLSSSENKGRQFCFGEFLAKKLRKKCVNFSRRRLFFSYSRVFLFGVREVVLCTEINIFICISKKNFVHEYIAIKIHHHNRIKYEFFFMETDNFRLWRRNFITRASLCNFPDSQWCNVTDKLRHSGEFILAPLCSFIFQFRSQPTKLGVFRDGTFVDYDYQFFSTTSLCGNAR